MSLEDGPPPPWQAGGKVFFDTNVLVYTDDHRYPEKHARARQLFREHRRAGSCVASTQVLQEYFSVTTGKLGVAAENAQRKVEIFTRLHIVQIDTSLILAAIDLHRLQHLSFWDALIVQAALAGGCRTLLSEDMAHGASIRGVRVVNPFADLA